ncbi:MAG: fructosamine kinase family protein [Lachnospiraceae bacterium]|nr:fructosamine kinase family protein [Lachnospiraceae bacterium]
MMLRSYDSMEQAVKACFGDDVNIIKRSYVGGGDINDSSRLQLSNGEQAFIKSNTLDNKGFFDAEETGLYAIKKTGTIQTPRLICKGIDRIQGCSFLMMEMITPAGKVRDFWETFGHELAAMHKSDTGAFVTGGKFGFYADNYIGASKQINSPKDTWISFFRELRLEPQFKMASAYFDKDTARLMLRLLDKLDDILVEPENPSLLHGDLWSGNYIVGNDGKAWLIDPATYVGHAEADLAMTELFGRFDQRFYDSYNETNPLQPGYRDRKDLYNLYHMLNHLNLFGRMYYSSVTSIIRRYAG